MPMRTALVGVGGRAHAFAKASRLDPDSELVACYAPTPVRREPFAGTYDIAAYSSLEAMLDTEKPDLVHIVTWPDARLEPMTIVAAHGVPACVVEKPVAVGVSDYLAMRDLGAKATTKFAVSHQLRWHRDLIHLRDAVARGAIGEPVHVEMTAGMNVAGQGTHVLDYGLSLIGDPSVVGAMGAVHGADSFQDAHSGPDGLVACLTLDGDVSAALTLGPMAPRLGRDPDVDWMHVRVAASGTKGRVEYREFGEWWVAGVGEYETGDCGTDEERRRSNHEAQARFHRDLIAWATGEGPEVGTSLANALAQWKVVLAIYESAIVKRPVTIEGWEPEPNLIERVREELAA